MLSRQVRSLLSLAVFGGLTAAAAVVGSRATQPKRNLWYRALRKPAFQPPALAFPIAWTGLYALMAVSANRVAWSPPSPDRTQALALWGTQLALNAAWSPLFFARRRPQLAMADMTALLGTVAAYTRVARRIDPQTTWFMAPYLGWLGFASALNADILRKNPRLASDSLVGR
ncbi:TspO/MBR family protein [Chondromyces apiculatus]|uniref:TspO/MBR family protein n=1 Tax=Chondromyces apiculatus DSM 436 TaxID=1192034 RepID=A0A017T4B3_9BACT|nr:TspO/MBR family protein [Chondromyces apiculatus]EYF03421.1 TspO/MBR family protein [Chondromyces apiculatus DSM 436]